LILDVPDGFRRAAVLIPIIIRENDWILIFTRRTGQMKSHKGEISFPGGRYDEEVDSDLSYTALRETEEELGIRSIKVLGQIDDILTISKYVVTPTVGYIEDNSEVNHQMINKQEIDYILEASLSKLSRSKIFSEKEVSYKGGSIFSVPFFDYEGEIIWGATGRILIDFFQKLNLLSPDCRLMFMNRDSWKGTNSITNKEKRNREKKWF
jgi:8-oxo-dGTP pyrophosphatase MutT (NUDIX family)